MSNARTLALVDELEERARAGSIALDELPLLVGRLAVLHAQLLARAAAPPAPPVERPVLAQDAAAPLLTPEAAGRLLSRSRWWVYRNREALPHTLLPGGRYGFSETGLRQWMAGRAAGPKSRPACLK